MLGAPHQGQGAGTPGVGGARDAPTACGSPGDGVRVPRARYTAAPETTARHGQLRGRPREARVHWGLCLPGHTAEAGQPAWQTPAVAEPLRGPGARQTHPRGSRAPPGCRLSRLPCPGSQRLSPSKEPQAAGRRPHSAASLGAPSPRGRRPLAASSCQASHAGIPAAAATAAAAGAEHTGWGGVRARPPPQQGRQASLRLDQR